MKIDAVELTLFSWDDIPPTRYTPGSQNVTGRSNLGLLRIATDEGIEGHALLGSAINPAETDAGALIRLLKPMLMGKDPLAREDLHAAMRARQRSAGLRVIDACDTALWDIGAKAAGMPLYKFLGGGRAHDCAGTSEGRPMETPRATVECADLARAFVFNDISNDFHQQCQDFDVAVDPVRRSLGDVRNFLTCFCRFRTAPTVLL